MITPEFKSYVSDTVARHFKNTPGPDGTTERNRLHIEIRDSACYEMRIRIAELTSDEAERYVMAKYADSRAQAAIYDLFVMPARKPRRYK